MLCQPPPPKALIQIKISSQEIQPNVEAEAENGRKKPKMWLDLIVFLDGDFL